MCSPVCCYKLHDQGQVTVHLCDLLPTLQDPGRLGRAVMGVVAGAGVSAEISFFHHPLCGSPFSPLLPVDIGAQASGSHFAPWKSPPSSLQVATGELRTAKAPGPAESFSSFSSHTGSWEMCRPFRDTEHLNLRCTFSRIHKPRFIIQLETNAQASKAVLGLSTSK